MKQCSLFCAGLWPFIVLPLLLLLPLLFFQWHAIEEDVAENVQTELAAIDVSWATVETHSRGRDVLITGTPPNQAAIEIVKEKASSVYGVNHVDISSDVRPPATPAELTAIITGESLILRGVLASQAAVDEVVAQAENAFGRDKVTNKLNISSNTADLPNLDGFFTSLSGKTFSLETINASLKGSTLSLKGTIGNAESNTLLISQLTDTLGLEINNTLAIAAPDVCLDLVNDLLSHGNIIFASGKATIDQASFELLENIKATASTCPEVSVEVSGHTDATGKLDVNMRLSGERAQAVIDHLAGLGLDTSKFTAAGYGPHQPIAENTTPEGRSQNRRIEFKLKN